MLHDWSVLTRTARDAPLALHLHISKTGGTTLRTLGASLLNRTDCNWNLREGQLPGHAQAARNSSCDFISIEAPAASLPWTWDGVSWPERGFTVTVLRNPFEQWYSVVRHTISLLSKQERSIPPSELALERHELAQSATAILRVGARNGSFTSTLYGGHDPRNMQTRWLGPSLDAALARISDSRMLVLITEFYDASLCLAAVAAGNFGSAARARCACTATRRPIAPHKNARPGLAGTEGGSAHYDLDANTEITELTGWLVDDLQLYAHALRLFFDDVRRAEESVGVRFLCAGNGIAAAPYQRWPHRPRAFDAPAK